MTTTRLAHWATTDNIVDAVTTTTAALGVLFVTLAGIVLSYNALWELARLSGAVGPTLTWLWPLTLDALAVVASLNVLWAEIRHERDRYAWSLVIAFTLLSVLFNAIHAGLAELASLHPLAPLVVGSFVGILPPIAAAFALHLLVRLLRRVLLRVSLIAGLADLERRRQALAAELEIQRRETAAELENLSRQIATQQVRLTELKAEVSQEISGKRAATVGELNAARQARIDQRRQELLALLPLKLSRQEMAERLGVGIKTVKSDLVALNGVAKEVL